MKQKNIILIMTDQHALHAISCYGATICKTPHIDTLAKDGVLFCNAHTPCALCAPARASLLTGLYPHRHGIMENVDNHPNRVHYERPDLDTFPKILKEAGYHLGYSGKWHAELTRTAGDMGFKGYGPAGFGNPDGLEYEQWLLKKGYTKPKEVMEWYAEGEFPKYGLIDGSGYTDGESKASKTAFIAETAMELLEECSKDTQPFLLICSFWGPHAAYVPSNDFKDIYNPSNISPWESFTDNLSGKPMIQKKHRHYVHPCAERADWATWAKVIARYYAYATEVDFHTGRLLMKIKELGLYEDSMIVFLSDHGETIGIHGGFFDKGPLAFEELYHIPLIIKMPAGESASTQRTQQVSLLDMAVTFCEIGNSVMPNTDGESLLPVIHNPDYRDRGYFVAEFFRHQFPGDQRILWWKNYKYVLNFCDTDELYDLLQDKAELHNLIHESSLSEIRVEMRKCLYTHIQKVKDQGPPRWASLLESP